ncbi:alpha/beta hydrolase-fold protein [uncultured Algibacter sp.]|uniref:alpha/beta hydrolase n=1 Tax=uncultured Algibacter sp. TaxID=298659 RepID=UPI00263711F0|nr:alpha/beta hydrolase-fold protein [uncultured Algibacter sp.]
MKKDLLFVLFLFVYGSVMAQTAQESIDSEVLDSKQSISIKLPKNYGENSDLEYPIILVLDGDYLLKPVIGQTDFQAYFENMPGAIIVGANYNGSKVGDNNSSSVSGYDAKFSKFIGEELLPYLDQKFNSNNFRVVVGYKHSASLMNSFLLNEQSLFQAYVNLSPEFTEDMSEKIIQRVQSLNSDVIYYIASSMNDSKSRRVHALNVNKELKYIHNNHFKFYFDDFIDMSHHTMVMSGVARGVEKVFENYKPAVAGKEMKEEVVSYERILD